jgi:hypothetical protein
MGKKQVIEHSPSDRERELTALEVSLNKLVVDIREQYDRLDCIIEKSARQAVDINDLKDVIILKRIKVPWKDSFVFFKVSISNMITWALIVISMFLKI